MVTFKYPTVTLDGFVKNPRQNFLLHHMDVDWGSRGILLRLNFQMPAFYRFITLILVLFNVMTVRADGKHPSGIILDGTLGRAETIDSHGGIYDIKAEYGKLAGSNLFHSFGQFNLHKGEGAAFQGPGNVKNIIGRITGGESSWIDGTLQSKITGADLYLLNPEGMIFGPNAKLDLSGSFYVSSADYLRLGNDGAFYADPKNSGNLLVSAPPSAFGFLDGDIGKIEFIGPENNFNLDSIFNLGPINWGSIKVKNQEELSVIGGGIKIDSYIIEADGGRIYLAGVASKGEVEKPDGGLDISSFEKKGDISVSQLSRINVSGKSGENSGSLFIEGKNFTLETLSEVASGGDGAGGVIDIRVENILIDDNAAISADSGQPGEGTDILIEASEMVRIDNGQIFFGSFSEESGVASGGKLTLRTKTLVVKGTGAEIGGQAFAAGKGGDIIIRATGSGLFSEGAKISTSAEGKTTKPGKAGDIYIETPRLTIESGASVKSESSGHGDAGTITVRANDFIELNNGEISTSSRKSGGGKIYMGVGKLLYLFDGMIATDVKVGDEKGGNIWIGSDVNVDAVPETDVVTESVVLNHGTISADADAGDGGAIDIHTDLYMKSVDSSVTAVSSKGNDGVVKIEAPDLDISGEIVDLPENFLNFDGLRKTPCSQRSGDDISYLKFTAGDAMPQAPDDLRIAPPLWVDE